MYSTFNQRVNANVEKLLNGASLYQVVLNAETLLEVQQSFRNYEKIKSWKDEMDLDKQEQMEEDWEEHFDYGSAFSWWDFENDAYSEDEYCYSYSDFWKEFCTKFDEIKNGIAEGLPSLPSDRELWLLRQARKAARLFPNRYWGSGMEKAWPKFVQKYHITTQEADIFWVEFHQYSNLINK